MELPTTEWVDWFNYQRLHGAIGDIPPAEHETSYYAQHSPNRRLESTRRASTDPGEVQCQLLRRG